mgnify:CR=1 FL=1
MNNNQNEWKNPSATDGTEGRTAPTLRDRRRKQKQSILYLVQLALLTAVIMVLHFSGVAIPAFGTKISLVLIPIALGAMLLGPVAGAILGFIYGMTVFISLGVLHMDPFTGFLFDQTPIMAALICTVKTTAVEWRKSFDASPAIYDCFLDGDMNRHAEGQGGVIYTNFTARNVMDKIAVIDNGGHAIALDADADGVVGLVVAIKAQGYIFGRLIVCRCSQTG